MSPIYLLIMTVNSTVALFRLRTGDTQEDAGCGQHARAVQHSNETDRKTSHPGQVHHDRRHAADLHLHVPGDQIPGLTTTRPRFVDESRTFLQHIIPNDMKRDRTGFLTSGLSYFDKLCHLFSTSVFWSAKNGKAEEDLNSIKYFIPLEAAREGCTFDNGSEFFLSSLRILPQNNLVFYENHSLTVNHSCDCLCKILKTDICSTCICLQ